MASQPAAPESPVTLVEQSLRSAVVDILRAEVAALRGMDRKTAYNAVMNNPDILHECFTLFRTRPELFASVVVDEAGVAAGGDESLLRCGATVADCKGMVVRAASRRHFHRRLGGFRKVSVPSGQPTSLLYTLSLGLLGRPPRVITRRVPGRGEKLYRAIRDFLRFEWQARLIPHYTEFSPDDVKQLGQAFLEMREPWELRAVSGKDGRQIRAQGGRPIFLEGADRLMGPNGDSIDAEILWTVSQQMELGRLIPDADQGRMRKIVSLVAGTSKFAISQLMPLLGSDMRLFVTFLFVAFARLGEGDFRKCFMEGGDNQWMAKVMIDRLEERGTLPAPVLEEMRQVFGAVCDLNQRAAGGRRVPA